MTPLRGREAELTSLDELAAAAGGGAGGVIVVEGAAGIGKSRLLAERVSTRPRPACLSRPAARMSWTR